MVISKEVVEGRARPLHIYTDRLATSDRRPDAATLNSLSPVPHLFVVSRHNRTCIICGGTPAVELEATRHHA